MIKKAVEFFGSFLQKCEVDLLILRESIDLKR